MIALSASFEESALLNNEKGLIDLDDLFNYANQEIPEKAIFNFNKDNPIRDETATLGRVLFYDKQLSLNGSTACASCHQQENAFGDSSVVSRGFDGRLTERHAMRLVNVGFSFDHLRFWDKRGNGLERTVTQPFKNDIEMGFSDTEGRPGFDSLMNRMRTLDYYEPLFEKAYGDAEITESRMQVALAHFIRSIISFDSKFDEGFSKVSSEVEVFSNFTDIENEGKRLFFASSLLRDVLPEQSGAFCGVCHKVPGFGLLHLSDNNGITGVAGDAEAIDLTIERSPSLRNLVKPDGSPLGPFMHDGSLATLEDVMDHYDSIPFNPANTNLSGLLFPDDDGSINLQLGQEKKDAIVAFMKTLTGRDIFTNEKWSNPFDDNGQLRVRAQSSCTEAIIDISETICSGEQVFGYNQSGSYEDRIVSESACDTIRRLTLTVLESTNEACVTTSTDDHLKHDITLYPNPFMDNVKFKNLKSGDYQLIVTNQLGQTVNSKSITYQSGLPIILNNLTPGMYFLKLKSKSDDRSYVFKVIKSLD